MAAEPDGGGRGATGETGWGLMEVVVLLCRPKKSLPGLFKPDACSVAARVRCCCLKRRIIWLNILVPMSLPQVSTLTSGLAAPVPRGLSSSSPPSRGPGIALPQLAAYPAMAVLPALPRIPKAQPLASLEAAGMKPVLPAQITRPLSSIKHLLAEAQRRNHTPALEVKNIN